MNADDFDSQKTVAGGREQTVWTVHESPSWQAGPAQRKSTVRWTLRVYEDGVVQTSHTVPYDGQRYYSTKDRRNRADKASEYRLSVEEVLDRHAAACEQRGGEVSVGELRAHVLAVLRDERVAANANGQSIDLLADGGTRS
jgi:hypothetical protein